MPYAPRTPHPNPAPDERTNCNARTVTSTATTAQFFDDKVMDKTRSQVYSDLIDVVVPAVAAAGFAEVTADAIGEKLALTGEGNSGSAVTLPMKWAVKYHRLRSIHVTPTVLVNGIEAPDISSGWTGEQWDEKIAALLA